MIENIVYPPHLFQPGTAVAQGAGRPKGSGNKFPLLLKELIALAAECEGSDGKGKDGILGYLRRIAKEDLKTFAMLLARIIPLQVEQRPDMSVDCVYRSVEEVRAELEHRGISMHAVRRILLGHDEHDDADIADPGAAPLRTVIQPSSG
jgi:hypothetical protein